MSADSLTLLQGDVAQLAPVVQCDGAAVSGAVISYSSSDTTTAVVAPDGSVTARAGGHAVLTLVSSVVQREVPVAVFGHPGRDSVVTRLLNGWPFGVSVSTGGIVLITRYDATSMGRYVLPAFTEVAGPAVPVTALDVAFTPSGTRAFATNYDQQQVTSIDVIGNVIDGSIPVGGRPLRVLLHPNGGSVFVTTDTDSLYSIDVVSRNILARAYLPSDFSGSGPNALAFSRDGAFAFIGQAVGQITKVATATLAVVDTFTVGSVFDGIALAPSADTIYVAESSPRSIRLIDANTHAILTSLALPDRPFDLRMTPDGAYLWVTAASRLFVIRRDDLVITDSIPMTPTGDAARRIAFDRYGRVGVVANGGGAVHLVR